MRYATLLMTTAIMLATPALADEKPPPLAVLNQSDIAELSRILDEQVPPHWSKPIVEFINRIIAQQQKKAEKPEVSQTPKMP